MKIMVYTVSFILFSIIYYFN